jgi:hypothetical protein
MSAGASRLSEAGMFYLRSEIAGYLLHYADPAMVTF